MKFFNALKCFCVNVAWNGGHSAAQQSHNGRGYPHGRTRHTPRFAVFRVRSFSVTFFTFFFHGIKREKVRNLAGLGCFGRVLMVKCCMKKRTPDARITARGCYSFVAFVTVLLLFYRKLRAKNFTSGGEKRRFLDWNDGNPVLFGGKRKIHGKVAETGIFNGFDSFRVVKKLQISFSELLPP